MMGSQGGRNPDREKNGKKKKFVKEKSRPETERTEKTYQGVYVRKGARDSRLSKKVKTGKKERRQGCRNKATRREKLLI